MKAYIIKSPGITRTRVKVTQITRRFSESPSFDIGDFSSLKKEKTAGYYKEKKILKIYRSSWEPDVYFVRHFI